MKKQIIGYICATFYFSLITNILCGFFTGLLTDASSMPAGPMILITLFWMGMLAPMLYDPKNQSQ